MSRVSTFAGSSFSPERMFRSTTAPVSRFLNLVRVNAAPLPGLTNWNSTMVYGLPSIKTFKPFRMSDVSYIRPNPYHEARAPCYRRLESATHPAMEPFDPRDRELCPDGACIGVIGPD